MSDIVERLSANVNWLMRDGFETSAKNVQCALAEIESLRQQLAEKDAENRLIMLNLTQCGEQLAASQAQKAQQSADFCDAIGHAISLGLDAHIFLKCWNEGDWDGCKEYGFEPSATLREPWSAMQRETEFAAYKRNTNLAYKGSEQETLDKLAASQAREAQLREAVRQNHEWHENYDEYGGYPESELAEVNEKALALPQDTTALEAMIAEAGEVMRERVMQARGNGNLYPLDIRALPGVTLEDLRK